MLTICPALLVEEDALDGRSDQHGAARPLDERDHVEGELAGAPYWVVGAALVVVQQESVDEEAGLLGRDACRV